ncbi:MAG TPA: hypothetical protein V6D23_09805 [Candidatus Obscuribacterales bacterium]
MHRALEKIINKAGVPELVDLLAERLSNGELTSLLLEVYRRRTEQLKPAQLLARLNQNRFVHPAQVDPIRLRKAELAVFELASAAGFTPVELSPLAPLGTSAAYGKVNQNNVLSALRGCELVSDPSSLMALLMTEQLAFEGSEALHWVSSQRTVRASQVQGPGMMSHFQLLAFCSLQRSMVPEALIVTALRHLELQKQIFTHFGCEDIRFHVRRKGKKPFLADRLLAYLDRSGEFAYQVETESGSDYYEGVQVKSFARTPAGLFELGDCGFVSWARELKSDAARNCFISGIGLERLLLEPQT